ncbi:MAG: thioredoxin [Pseudomonadota bacterium]
MAELLNLTAETYDQVIKSSGVPVMVDFWAFWCGPCKVLAPILESIQDELAGSVRITKLDVEKYPEIAEREQVQAFPTLIIYKDGTEHFRLTGVKPRQYLLNMLNSVVEESRSDSNSVGLYKNLSIHDALMTGEIEAVQTVLKNNPDAIHHAGSDGERPLRFALKRRQIDAIPVLIQAKPELEFVEYVALNMLSETKAELDRDPSLINTYFDEDNSVLELAALWGAEDTLKELLLRSPPVPDLSEQKQAKLLLKAVCGLNPRCLEALFDAGINFFEDQNLPLVALAIRIEENRDILDIIKILIEHGAKPNPVVHGKSVSEMVREYGWKELLPELDALVQA